MNPLLKPLTPALEFSMPSYLNDFGHVNGAVTICPEDGIHIGYAMLTYVRRPGNVHDYYTNLLYHKLLDDEGITEDMVAVVDFAGYDMKMGLCISPTSHVSTELNVPYGAALYRHLASSALVRTISYRYRRDNAPERHWQVLERAPIIVSGGELMQVKTADGGQVMLWQNPAVNICFELDSLCAAKQIDCSQIAECLGDVYDDTTGLKFAIGTLEEAYTMLPTGLITLKNMVK